MSALLTRVRPPGQRLNDDLRLRPVLMQFDVVGEDSIAVGVVGLLLVNLERGVENQIERNVESDAGGGKVAGAALVVGG